WTTLASRAMAKKNPPALPPPMLDPQMITTAFSLAGHQLIKSCGVVCGFVVTDRSITLNADAQGRANAWNKAFDRMRAAAIERGGNAVIGCRCETSESAGRIQIVASGTAVEVAVHTGPYRSA